MARWILAVVLLLTTAIGCGGDETSTQGRMTTTLPGGAPETGGRPGELVPVGEGLSLFVHCVGSGNPTVVLETGLGADASQWRHVQPDVARGTRVCAYDRGGTGNSVARPGVRDAREAIADLRRWLARERIDPPYVVAGHSYGGVLARVFAHLHPNETAGLVLIDTMGRDARRRTLDIWPESQAPRHRELLATTAIGDVNLALGEAIAGGVPAEAGAAEPSASTAVGSDARGAGPAVGQQRARDRTAQQHDVPSSRTGQPTLVVRAVRAVVDAARDGTRLAACSRTLSGPGVRCRG